MLETPTSGDPVGDPDHLEIGATIVPPANGVTHHAPAWRPATRFCVERLVRTKPRKKLVQMESAPTN